LVRIAVLDDYQGVASSLADWGRLPADSSVEFFREHIYGEDAVVERLQPYEVVVAMRERTPFLRSTLERLPNLKLLISAGARNRSIDVGFAKSRGIVVSGTRGVQPPTPELAWGLILALARNITREDRSVRNGGWQETLGTGLAGTTLGLLGLGRLGSYMAKIGNAFGMEVIAWSQNLTEDRALAAGARLVHKDDLFRRSDFLSIHVVLSDRTRGLVTARELGMMKPSAYLINTSRGPIVDEKALIETLRANRIAGAGIDVFSEEPLPLDHPFRALPNTVITPHLGYVTEENYRFIYGDAVEDILAFLDGTPVREYPVSTE
jgi:phosphoglycerate dehydrogenase-like enzyme